MGQRIAMALLIFVLAGCSSLAGSTTATPTPTTAPPAAAATRGPGPAPTPTVTIGRPYGTFLHTLCSAFAARNAGTVINLLPYFAYNSGLRYGMLGDGEGQTGDPSLMRSWLAQAHPHCVSFTPGYNAHGTVLTVGWQAPGPVALLDLDIFNGHWKINDFTFGSRAALSTAMRTSFPIVAYKGQ